MMKGAYILALLAATLQYLPHVRAFSTVPLAISRIQQLSADKYSSSVIRTPEDNHAFQPKVFDSSSHLASVIPIQSFQENPKKILPLLLSDIMKNSPATKIGLKRPLQKLLGTTRKINTSVVLAIQLLTIPGMCFPIVKIATSLLWPFYVRMMQQFGSAPAFFATYILYQTLTVPFGCMLTMPFLTPLSPESRTNAKKNWEKFKGIAGNWKIAQNAAIGALLYPAGIYMFSPRAIFEATAIPSFAFWSTYRAFLFFFSYLDIMYYALHRLMHWRGHKGNPIFKWLNKIHTVHHCAHGDALMPSEAAILHEAELIGTVSAYMVGPLLWRAHPALSLAWINILIVNAMVEHTSYLRKELCDHVMHHERSNCNYGLIGLTDHLCKTSMSSKSSMEFNSES
jgi:sterol desaturase/sphingolipid hydroxylase (fatty acid hydroxylase superfamily)